MTRHEQDGLTRRQRREARKQTKRERKDAPRIARALLGGGGVYWPRSPLIVGEYRYTIETEFGAFPELPIVYGNHNAGLASKIGTAYSKPPNRRERRAARVDWNAVARGTEVHPDYQRTTKLK